MQSWNFPYLYNIPTYFADIDGISHIFKHKLHDKQGVKVIWGQGHSRLQNKNNAYFKSKKITYYDWNCSFLRASAALNFIY